MRIPVDFYGYSFMAVENTPRRAGPFVSDGTTVAFDFTFRVFQEDEVGVSVSATADEDAPDISLVYLEDFTVRLNDDQETNPGGRVVLLAPVAKDIRLTLNSLVPETQETVLTNHDGFSPKILNTVHDKLTILVQQLSERADRTLVVPKTSAKSPSQLLTEIIDIAKDANEYAVKSEQTYNATLATKALVEQIRVHVDQQKALVDASEAEVEEDRLEVEQMLGEAKEVNEVTQKFLPMIDELGEIGESIEDIRAVASELQGLPIESMDLGFISDKATPIYDTKQSNVAVLAANIELLQQVVDNIASIQTAVDAAQRAEQAAVTAVESANEAEVTVERVKEIEKTDFEQIYEEGVEDGISH